MKDPKEFLDKISKLEPSKQIVDTLIALVREAFREIQLLKDEIAILKNQKPRPKIEPSKLEKDEPKGDSNGNRSSWSKGSKNQKLIIDREIKIEISDDQKTAGLVFKGYRDFIVQELIITKEVTKYRLAQWENPDGTYISAKLPEAINNNHFGPGIRRYIIDEHNANRVPQN